MIFADRTTRGLVVRNLASGEITPLTHKTAGSAREAIISPDGKEVAFFWTVPGVGLEVQIAPLTAETDPRVLHRSASGIALKDWSPDGRSLLVTVMKDGEFHIATLSVEDGSIRDLKSTGRVRPVVAKFSPDGGYIVYDTGPRSAMASDIFVLSADGSQHSAVVQHPANDNSPIWSPDSSRIFYVSHRTATPSLWSVPIKDGKLDGVEEPVRSDVGAITPLAMTPTGILYYGVLGLNRRNIYRVGLKDGKSAETPKVATDRFVNANWGASVSIDGKYLAYYSNRPDTVLAIRDLSNGQERVHPLAIEVNAAFFDRPGWLPEAHSVLLVGRDNPTRPEALYRIDLDNGNPEVVGRTISFEFEVSPDGKSVFSLGAPRYVLSRINLEDGVATGVRPVPYNGGPSTLVGLSLAVSPDATRIAYIHNAEIVVSPVPGDEPRVIFRYPEGNLGNRFGNRMTWSRDDNILFTLEEGSMQSIWRIPSNGGTAEPLGVSINGEIRGPSMHPDGQSLFFTVVEDPINEIWALQNFLPN
jgi:Tol biopolymer transport system component